MDLLTTRKRLEDGRQILAELRSYLDVEQRERRAGELEAKMAAPEFWSDPEAAQKIVSELKALRRIYEPYRELEREVKDAEGLIALVEQEPDESLADELERQSKMLLPKIQALELQSLLSEESDAHGAIVTIHPGAGGTESQDWAQMLFRMYTRYLERKGFPSQVLDLQAGEEAGIKDATVEVDAPFGYGYLKAERGVHRLVRISPYDANHRRHTSFASVFVYPLAEGNGDLEVPEGELRIDTFRASGAGGQHVNKTESAVRITHVPTGIAVQCQNERSQHRNRDAAMKILKARLYSLKIEEDRKKREVLTGGKKDIAWGSQIRSYVFHPYTLVKDHRTDLEVRDVQRVMDGDLDPFIDAYLRLKEPK
ncbi:MAG: peptide chain release factor 2 [Candidatus Eisenbacteria bacterium]|uniref:Peptide chain release factor 2 n=1 Tax=Eiseniibacteriota bacterium TaxID=2212470 RepID=A0A538T3J3_UNCEI|nr:MAG: peptide chain release factor 2 [Candidatus Eisenbacteria bacterium]